MLFYNLAQSITGATRARGSIDLCILGCYTASCSSALSQFGALTGYILNRINFRYEV